MKRIKNTKLRLISQLLGAMVLSTASLSVFADKTDDIIDRGLNRQKTAVESQKRIDDIAEATDKVIAQYQQQVKAVEGLKIYNDRMNRTLTEQERAMARYQTSIDEASLIERQIVPLMLKMIDSLDAFIAADLPFQQEERKERIARIRSYLSNANVSASERFRQVLTAYNIETDHGNSIDVFVETLDINGENITVNLLKVGRASLYYQTLDGTRSGYWDKEQRQWVALDSSYNSGIQESIRIAQGKVNADLMDLPLPAPEVL